MNVIQDSLSTILLASPESKTVILKEILSQIQTKAFLSKDLFNPLIDILQLTLNDPNIEISLLSSNLLTEIIQQKENKSYENNFSECLNSVVRNLGDSQV